MGKAADEIFGAFDLDQPRDVENGRRFLAGIAWADRPAVDADVVDTGAGHGKPHGENPVPDEGGGAEKQCALLRQAAPEQRIVRPGRRAQECRRRERRIEAMEGRDQRNSQLPRQWQRVNPLNAEMGVDQRRPSRSDQATKGARCPAQHLPANHGQTEGQILECQ